jgi:calcium-dependent phosphoinositide phospholipase C
MLTRRFVAALALVAVVPLLGMHGCRPGPQSGLEHRVRLNEVQVLGSHNSYHVEPEPALLRALRDALGDEVNGFEYTHRPLADELDAGVRQIELDAFLDDPGGGRFASPKLVPLLGLAPVDPRLSSPGIKVFHVQEVDFRSTCPTFVDCLTQVRDWSDAHRGHLPIVIQVEPKDDTIADPGLGFVTPIAWTSAGFASLEAEIRSVFPDGDRVITPGDVKGRFPTLRQAVEHDRWPTLARARGQVMFVLDDGGEERAAYRALHPSVDDRLIFTSAAPPDDDAGVVVVNDPVGDGARIRQLVEDGFMVRTRADADTVQARSGDTSQQQAAWASGAQFVSTDYPFPEDHFGTGYVAAVPGDGVARCNPVAASRFCARIEHRIAVG